MFIDLKKPFDTVNHNILIQKLEYYGIRNAALNWFKSYLTERKQFVFINGVNSETRQVTCGVPQGSVLGPLLFLIYINDLSNISKKLNFFLFAEDTNIYIYMESDNLKVLEKNMNIELKKLYDWLCINRLSLNITKTNFVIFHSINKPKTPVTILIDNEAIDEAKYVKYLGILIDSQLTFRQHIDELTKKISRGIGVLYKLSPFTTTKILTNIYYAIIYPFLLYGITVWGTACNTHIAHILILQKRFVRLATYNDTYPDVPGPLSHTISLFHRLKILKIFDIFKLQLGKLVYESINHIGPSHNIIQFTRSNEIHDHNTKYAYRGNFFNNYVQTTSYGLKSLIYMGGKLWATIPISIQDCLTSKSFIRNMKIKLINDYCNQ